MHDIGTLKNQIFLKIVIFWVLKGSVPEKDNMKSKLSTLIFHNILSGCSHLFFILESFHQ